jgi:hypothetical protein
MGKAALGTHLRELGALVVLFGGEVVGFGLHVGVRSQCMSHIHFVHRRFVQCRWR